MSEHGVVIAHVSGGGIPAVWAPFQKRPILYVVIKRFAHSIGPGLHVYHTFWGSRPFGAGGLMGRRGLNPGQCCAGMGIKGCFRLLSSHSYVTVWCASVGSVVRTLACGR